MASFCEVETAEIRCLETRLNVGMDYLTLRLVSFILSNSIGIPLLSVYLLQLIFLCSNRDIYNSTFYKLFAFQGILVRWRDSST